MRSIWLIGRHEFTVTAGRLGYRILVAAVPVVVLVALVSFAAVRALTGDDEAGDSRGAAATIGYVDLTADADGRGLFDAFHEQGSAVFVPYPDRGAGVEALLSGSLDVLYVFPVDFAHRRVVIKVEEQQAGIRDFGGGHDGNRALRNFILSNFYAEQIGIAEVGRLLDPYMLSVVEVNESGAPAEQDSDGGRLLFFLAVSALLLVSVLTTAGYLMQGLSEEKESRVMEVLLSSIQPEQLMLGKLLGLATAGLLQVAVWTIAVVAALFVLGRISDIPTDRLAPSAGGIAVALPYFLLGYAFFGTLQAAFGAITTNQREASTMTAFIVLPACTPLWFLQAILSNPEGTLARALSFVPFTAPTASLIRLGVDGMGALDLMLSLGTLTVSAGIVVLLTARLFKAYLLTFGQRPGISELLGTLRGG